jgi:putative effector of murein hydrolase LrgA (UPF0299 family)
MPMAPRAVGAALGFLAFATSVFAGLWVGHPIRLTLSRSIWAMFIFAIIGLLLGLSAQVVVRERLRQREASLFSDEDDSADAELELGKSSTGHDSQPMES